ncbi:Crp/Fnr family transcriptional regulator [Pukyongiella litopenaei]|uniref:Crp/Fnr family transcriptional regulator n=2 Tax=Pukyongiella litopenaei TaxID=2605946 RepID=A0A2S0MV45_9RHOB|nr:Crp/Fnr family transcriptional regulator [Pukyongiella litopenaei]
MMTKVGIPLLLRRCVFRRVQLFDTCRSVTCAILASTRHPGFPTVTPLRGLAGPIDQTALLGAEPCPVSEFELELRPTRGTQGKMVQMDQSPRSFSEIMAPLDDLGWLASCSAPLQRWVSDNGRWVDVSAGKALFREGDHTVGMYGVGSGAIDIEFAPDGIDGLTTVRVQPGGWLGQSTLLPTMTRPFNLVAAVDSRVYFLSRNTLRNFLAGQPEFWPEFYALALRQVLTMMTYLGEAQWLTPEARVARQLLRLSVTENVIEIRQGELVILTGMSRSNVRRALRNLAEAKAVNTRYRSIEIVDRVLLERTSNQFG